MAADTGSPTVLSTGTLSPVRALSSSALLPSRMTPSTGTCSPGRTANSIPHITCSMGTVRSFPFSSSTAVLGASCIKRFSASVVLPLERASRVLPTVISVKIIAADSK